MDENSAVAATDVASGESGDVAAELEANRRWQPAGNPWRTPMPEPTPVKFVGALVEAAGRPWALRPEAMDVLIATLRSGIVAGEVPARTQKGADAGGGVTVVPLKGMITPNAGLLGALFGVRGGLEAFRTDLLEAATSPDVQHIVLNVDSPGGLVDLVPEVSALIREVRGAKPVTAVANTMAASAAYWLASQADELVVTPSGEVGSIGVYMMHVDRSAALEAKGLDVTLTSAGKYKTEGNEFEPLSGSARKNRQERVDTIYGMFVDDVAAGRGVTDGMVINGYGEGRTMMATEAVDNGLADRVGTLDDVLLALGSEPDVEEDDPLIESEDGEAAMARAAAELFIGSSDGTHRLRQEDQPTQQRGTNEED